MSLSLLLRFVRFLEVPFVGPFVEVTEGFLRWRWPSRGSSKSSFTRFTRPGAVVEDAVERLVDELWSESLRGGAVMVSGEGEPDDLEVEVDVEGMERLLERRGSLGDNGGAIEAV